MNPLDALLAALAPYAQPTKEFLFGRPTGMSPADVELNRAGSVMGSERTGERANVRQQGPALSALTDVLNFANPVNWMGGMAGGTAAHVPGTFRKIGLARVQGTPGAGRAPLNPGEYLARLQQEANYPRFQELVQALTRRQLGPEFNVFRGAPLSDELLLRPLTQGQLPEVTAGSLKPEVARDFATWMGKALPGESTQVARITATPESVMGLLPRRGAKYASEAELIIDPRKALDIALQGGIQTKPYTTTPPNKELEQLLLDALEVGRSSR